MSQPKREPQSSGVTISGPGLRGPIGRGPVGVKGQGAKDARKTIGRLLRYLLVYKGRLILVLACILMGGGAGVAGSFFMRVLIDDYITPMTGLQNPDFFPLLRAVLIMACVYALGTASGLVANLIMVGVRSYCLLIWSLRLFICYSLSILLILSGGRCYNLKRRR